MQFKKETTLKKFAAALLSTALIGTSAFMPQFADGITASAAESGNGFQDAISIAVGSTVRGNISDSSDTDYYKFVFEESGTVTISFKGVNSDLANIEKIELCSSSGNYDIIKKNDFIYSGTTGRIDNQLKAVLKSGTYYITVYSGYYNTGDYDIGVSFETSNETIKESLTKDNDTLANADTVSINKTYNAQIAATEKNDFYKFVLTESGKVSFDVTGYMSYCGAISLYKSNGDLIKQYDYLWSDYSTNRIEKQLSAHLKAGTYYAAIENSEEGNYRFALNFTSAKESCKESENNSNDTIDKASTVSINKDCKGQIAETEKSDFYKFTLKESGTVKIQFKGYMNTMESICAYDSKKDVIKKWDYLYQDSTIERIEKECTLYLRAGTYYLGFENNTTSYGRDGNYTFNINFTSAKESFPESVSKNNDTFANASNAAVNKTYKGQIAYDEGADYCKFTIKNKTRIKIPLSGNVPELGVYIYNTNKKAVWSNGSVTYDIFTQQLNTTLGNSEYNKIELPKGTYYLKIEGRKNNPGNYSFKLSCPSANTVKLNKTSVTLGKGENFTLTATVNPTNAHDKTITWKTSNSKVATVKNGKITAKKAGTVTITATSANGKKATCKVTVKNAPSKVTLNKKTLTLKKGKSATLKVSLPKNTASYKKTFTSSNKSVATVSSSGKVTAKKAGTATITVKTFNGKTYKCKVTVKNK